MENKNTRKQAPQAAATEQHTSREAKRRPLKTIRVEDVSASIWARERLVKGEMMVFYSVTFERSYRDNAGEWRYTRYFDLNDLGKLVASAQQASEFIGECQKNSELGKAA